MSAGWIAPHPRCPVHGQMTLITQPPQPFRELPPRHWECRGWDGEGCGHVVTDEELDWRLAGPAEGLSLKFGPVPGGAP